MDYQDKEEKKFQKKATIMFVLLEILLLATIALQVYIVLSR